MQKENFPFRAVPPSHWPIASTAQKCVMCGKAFGLFQVAENCRGCGRVCCSSCLSERLVLPGQPGTAPVAVCLVCAKSITRTHEEAEMAMERCQLLEEILNEQALQAEKLRSDLREQQAENKLLQHEKERLKATIARMEIEFEVAAAKAEAASPAAAAAAAVASASLTAVSAASPTTTSSPAASPAKPDSETSALGDGAALTDAGAAALEEQLNKKKRQLDMREATLKDALKKVSADAARNADQRAALQEQERQLTALVTSKFTALFEEERRRLEDLCTEAVTDVQGQYVAWVGQQQDSALERKRKYEHIMEERLQRANAELAEVRASRDALQRQFAAERESAAALAAAAQDAAAPVRQQEQEQLQAVTAASQQRWLSERAELEHAAAAAARRAEATEEDLRRLQSELEATKAAYEEEALARESGFSAFRSEQQQVQQRLEAELQECRAQQADAGADTAASIAAAVEAAQRKAAETQEAALSAQQQRLESKAAADMAVRVHNEEQAHAANVESLRNQYAAEIKVLKDAVEQLEQRLQDATQQKKEDLQERPQFDVESASMADKAEREAAHATAAVAFAAQQAELKTLYEHDSAHWKVRVAQLEAQLREEEKERAKLLNDAAAAAAVAAEAHVSAVAELKAQHKIDKDTLEKKALGFKRTQTQPLEGSLSQDKSWKEEKAALQKTCKELEARLEARKTAGWQLQQQLRDCKQQLAELQAQAQKKADEVESAPVAQSRASTALQRSAAAIVKETQQAQQRITTEHGAALAQMRSFLQEAARAAASASSVKERKGREVAKQLQAQVASLKEDNESSRQLLRVEQEKRGAAEAKLESVKAALHALQGTEQQQRQSMAHLREQYEAVVSELEAVKSHVATHDARGNTPPASTEHPNAPIEEAARLIAAQQQWVQQRSHLESFYVMTLNAVVQHEWAAAVHVTVRHLAEDAERQRQLRARNAKALENTTSTIREVQEDLRVRSRALAERQSALDEEERRVAEKRKRIDVVCRDLYAVAKELRRKHQDDSGCAEVEEVVRTARIMGGDV